MASQDATCNSAEVPDAGAMLECCACEECGGVHGGEDLPEMRGRAGNESCTGSGNHSREGGAHPVAEGDK
jgi:hypothetical protein